MSDHPRTAHYSTTERRLRELLQQTADKLSARTIAEAWGFIAEGEYVVCLETIADGLTPRGSAADRKLILALAVSMDMNTEGY